jgi:hypothetical protein
MSFKIICENCKRETILGNEEQLPMGELHLVDDSILRRSDIELKRYLLICDCGNRVEIYK